MTARAPPGQHGEGLLQSRRAAHGDEDVVGSPAAGQLLDGGDGIGLPSR